MIEVRNLTFEYPNQLALDDVSFNVERNTITALVGPNGAGKTTLLKCLAALIKPYNGEIRIEGNDIIENPRSINPLIGFMPDFFGLYDNLSVRQAMQYYAMAYDLQIENLDEHILGILHSVNLDNKIDAKIGALSRGMRQRMAIAQSIIHKPKLLLLDEPASGLDPEARSSLTKLFLDLNKSDMTIIVSSHILSELDDYATNLIVLKEGKIIEKKVGDKVVESEVIISIITNEIFETYIPLLGEINDLTLKSHQSNQAEFIYTGKNEDQHMVLKTLMDRGVKINEFFTKKSKLKDHYIELINN